MLERNPKYSNLPEVLRIPLETIQKFEKDKRISKKTAEALKKTIKNLPADTKAYSHRIGEAIVKGLKEDYGNNPEIIAESKSLIEEVYGPGTLLGFEE